MTNETILHIPHEMDDLNIIEQLQFVFNLGLWETELITISTIVEPIAAFNNIPRLYNLLREARKI